MGGGDASSSQRAGGKIGSCENNKSIPKSSRGERDHVAGGAIDTAAQRHRGNESVGERRRKKLKCRRSWGGVARPTGDQRSEALGLQVRESRKRRRRRRRQ